MEAYLQHGTGTQGPYSTERVEVKTTEVPRYRGRQDGYGNRIPTRFMVRYNNRWRRVYAICWSNVATFYIGGKGDAPMIIVQLRED